MNIEVPEKKWYDLKLNMDENYKQQETLATDFVTENWSYSISWKNNYQVLWYERYPMESRDYSDRGYCIQVISNQENIPLCVAWYDWSHCSCYGWSDDLDKPEKVYKFSDYIAFQQLNCYDEHYLCSQSIHEEYSGNHKMEENTDELFSFWHLVRFIITLPICRIVREI